MKKSSISRRNFLGKAATVGVAGVIVPTIITSCAREKKKVVEVPVFLDQAPDGPVLKAGIIGCGGRGTGAAINFLSAGPNLQVTALGDTFQDRVDNCKARILKEKNQEVPAENCFVGFDAYQKVIDSGVDIVILATPPFFRPEHLAAAVAAKKHIFAEKPLGLGATDAYRMAAAIKKAGVLFQTGYFQRGNPLHLFLREQIGSGGMADVYQAWDNLRATRMAIKVLRRDLAQSARFNRMFEQEAELLRKLEHPNIVRLYEFDKEGDVVFIVMDWVEGTNLRQAINDRKKPFSLEEVSQILQPVCAALNYAHQNMVFHCDVKPGNIMVDAGGTVYLTDFGIAQYLSSSDRGALHAGTPAYMAPEQIRGEIPSPQCGMSLSQRNE